MDLTLEQQLKQKLVETLELKIDPDQIDDDAPLFGGRLGLDSVDLLEVSAMLSLDFSIEIADLDNGREVLANIRSLAECIRQRQSR
jgi:acyl carrier protein